MIDPASAAADSSRPRREGSVPRAVHPWLEDEPARVARGITLGVALSAGAWTLVVLVALLMLAVLA